MPRRTSPDSTCRFPAGQHRCTCAANQGAGAQAESESDSGAEVLRSLAHLPPSSDALQMKSGSKRSMNPKGP